MSIKTKQPLILTVLASLAYLSIAIAAIVVTITILNLPKDEKGNKIWSLFESNSNQVAITPKTVVQPVIQSAKTAFVASNDTSKNVNFYDDQASDNVFEQNGATLKTIIKLDGVAFVDNTLELASSSYARLRVAVVALNKFSKFSILVAVHTDNIGDSEENKILSKKQAETVKNYFINQGIKPSRLASIGFGAEQPIDDNNTEEGRKANKRVELRIY